jgi:hypothetical protein
MQAKGPRQLTEPNMHGKTLTSDGDEPLNLHEVALQKAQALHQAKQQSAACRPLALKFQIAGEARQYLVWPKRKIKRSWMEAMHRRQTKRIRLTKSILVDGVHAAAGSVQDLAQPLADDLIAQNSAVQLNAFSRFLTRIRLFLSRTKTERS